jgi:hypothetical protein
MTEKLARGCYQEAILNGTARLSGADLKGKARYWGSHYSRSRKAVLSRLKKHGIPAIVTRGRHNLLELHLEEDALELIRSWPTPLRVEEYLGLPLIDVRKM